MDDMVEKVARAIWKETRTKWDQQEIAGTTAWTRANYERIARTALEACHYEELIEVAKSAVNCFPTHQTGCMARDVIAEVEANDA